MVLRTWVITLLLVLLPVVVAAQSVDDAVEQWLVEGIDEGEAAAMADMLAQMADEPFNLNDTAVLGTMPLLSPFMQRALCNYIMLYGQLLSLNELAFVPGFDSATVERLRPYVTVRPCAEREPWHLREGRHTLVYGLGGTVEQAAGYADGRYEGDNLRSLVNYSFSYRNRLNIRIVADKDAGEQWGQGNFYGYHLMLSDVGRVERLIVGRYNLQFGQGVAMWTGMRPFGIIGQTTMRFGSGVRPAAAFYEEGYQEGVAATIAVGRGFSLSPFASRVGGENLFGTHAAFRKGNLLLGTTLTYTALDDSVALRDYVYNATYFRGNRQACLGVDGMWQWRWALLYGEAAADIEGHVAAIVGGSISPSTDNRFGIAVRHYDPLYHNMHADAYAVGSTRAEDGVVADAALRLPGGVRMTSTVDIYSFSTLRYGSYAPSAGSWLRVQAAKDWHGRRVALRYASRIKERNVPGLDSAIYVGEQTVRRQLQAEARLPLGTWQLVARASWAAFESEHGADEVGWLIYAAMRYKSERMRADVGVAYHDVGGYDARLYLSENTLQYFWTMPMLTGRGLRGHAMVQADVGRVVTVAARYSLAYMPDVEAIGSGAAQTDGSVRQVWQVLAKVRF